MAVSPQQFPPGYLEETRQPLASGVTAMFIVVVTFVVILRFVSRRLGKIDWKRDDTLMLLAYLVFMTFMAMTIASTVYGGAGRHMAYLTLTDPGKVTTFLKLSLALPLVYYAAANLPRLALLSLYLDIFIQKPFRIACWICAGIMIANWLANMIVAFVQCVPLSYIWEQISAPGTGRCIDVASWGKWSGIANSFTDVVILILPIPTVMRLQVSTAVRIGVLITFLLGSSGIVASLARFIFFYKSDRTGDPSWSAVNLIISIQLEISLYMIAASLPSYRPLLNFLGLKVGMIRTSRSSRNTDTKINDSLSRDKLYRSDGKFSRSDRESNQKDSIELAGVPPMYKNTVLVHTSTNDSFSNDSFSRDHHQLYPENYDPLHEQQIIPENRIGVTSDITLSKS